MSTNGAIHEVPEVEVTALAPHDALAIMREPDVVLTEATRAAKALSKVIEAKPKKVQFNGKTYLQFEDWQTLGRFYGVTAVGRNAKYVEYGEGDTRVKGFEAEADALLVSSNQVISSAQAMCLNDEPNWSKKPLFQLKSMAQTRACAKALRNVLAWVVVLAGYAPTPAEEMEQESSMDDLPEQLAWLADANDADELRKLFTTAYKKAASVRDQKAMDALVAAKDRRKKELAA